MVNSEGIENSKNGTHISVWNIPSIKKDYLFRSSIAPGNFPLE